MLEKIIKVSLCLVLMIVLSACTSKLETINKLEDLNNKAIGITTGSEYDTIANKNLENPKLSYYNTYSDQTCIYLGKQHDPGKPLFGDDGVA